MGIIARQAGKSTLVLFIGVALGYLTNLVVFPLGLTPGQIGLIRVIISFATMAATVASLGIPGALVKYFPYFKNKATGHSGILGFSFVLTVAGLALAFLLLTVFREQVDVFYEDHMKDFHENNRYIFPIVFALTLITLLTAYSRALMRITVPFFMKQVVLKIFLIVLVMGFYLKWYGFEFVLNGVVGSYILVFVVLLFYVNRLDKAKFQFNRNIFHGNHVKQFLTYGGFVILTGMGTVTLQNIDFIMMGALAGMEKTGIYSIAFFIGNVIELPKRAITQISSPIVANAFKENNLAKIDSLYKQTSVHNFLAGTIILVLVWVNVDNFFAIMPKGEIYAEGKYVILFVALGKLIDVMLGLNGQIIMLSDYYRYNLLLTAGLVVVSVVSNYILIPIMGMLGAAIATAGSLALFNLAKFIFVNVKFNFSPFNLDLGKVVLTGLIPISINHFIPELINPFFDIVLRSLIITAVFAGLILIIKPSAELQKIMKKLNKYFPWK